jgi:hypothetical protein
MNILPTFMPAWVSIAFISLFPVFIFLIAAVARKAAVRAGLGDTKARQIYRLILSAAFVFYVYIAAVSLLTNWFNVNSLPPRILIFGAVPLFLGYMLVVSNTKTYRTLLTHVTLPELIRLHVFRLIGVFFILLYAYGALPKGFALAAGLGDIFVALTAIIVANLVERQHLWSKSLVMIWNIVGAVDIFNVIATALITTRLSILTGSQNLLAATNFPYSWIPAFAPATILFLHITIFRKWRMVYR